MRVSPGVRLGPYVVVAPIGAGGMGEVWRARDERLGRDVAIKFLPEAFVSDAARLHRFAQESRAAGTLNHPNLVTVFDVGTDPGAPFVVMELLEGETLREKLTDSTGSGRLPIRKAVDYGVQIANGLAAAHQRGIVHRDLKPENILVTPDGRVKIVDFGLAKVASSKADTNTGSPTQQHDTAPGTVVGTTGYMSPEQVLGKVVDQRSDIFSFGAVLYEMLSGHRAFQSDSSVETMNAILKADPPELTLPPANVPPAIDLVVRHCLEKNPEERFQSAKDIAFDLQRSSSISASSTVAGVRKRAQAWLAPTLIVAVLAIAAVAAWRSGYRLARAAAPRSTAPSRTFALLTNQAGIELFPCLSPDGKTFVFVSRASGNADIYLQRVDGKNAINLTKDSPVDDTQPAFSPDGSQIAFRSEREGGGIFIMGGTGESVRRVSDFGFNPSWSPDGSEIAVAAATTEIMPQLTLARSTISVINVRTGARRAIAGEQSSIRGCLQPSWSPHGDRIAFWAVAGSVGQRDVFTIDAHDRQPLKTITRVTNDAALDWNPVWSPDGKYLFFSSDRDGTMNLWRIPMDEHSGRPLGPPEPASLPTRFAAHFSFARNTGALAYAGIDLSSTLWRVPFDPTSLRVTGEPAQLIGGPMVLFGTAEVSPDGQSIAFSNLGPQEDLYIVRTDGSELRQLTNDPEKDRAPSWSPDGKTLYFFSARGGQYDVWSIRADGSGLRRVSMASESTLPLFPRLMPDGRALYAFNFTSWFMLPLDGNGVATRVEPFPTVAGVDFVWPILSPDRSRFALATGPMLSSQGIWLYSPASRKYEQLTTRGTWPRWLDDRRIVFVDGTALAVVEVGTKRVHPISVPRAVRTFSMAPDGRTIYVLEQRTESHIWLMTEK